MKRKTVSLLWGEEDWHHYDNRDHVAEPTDAQFGSFRKQVTPKG